MQREDDEDEELYSPQFNSASTLEILADWKEKKRNYKLEKIKKDFLKILRFF